MADATWIRTHGYRSVWTGGGQVGSQAGLTVGYGGTTAPAGGAIIAGNVGIGTTAPTARLEVVGNIIAAPPTAANHVATRGWVEAAMPPRGCPSEIEGTDRAATTIMTATVTCAALGTGWRVPTSEELACFFGHPTAVGSWLRTRTTTGPFADWSHRYLQHNLINARTTVMDGEGLSAFRCVR